MSENKNYYETEQFETFCELGKYITDMDDNEFNEKFIEIQEMSDDDRLNERNNMRDSLISFVDEIKEKCNNLDMNNESDRKYKMLFMSFIPDLMWVIDILNKTMNEDGSIRTEEELEAEGIDFDKFITTFNDVLLKVAMVKKATEEAE